MWCASFSVRMSVTFIFQDCENMLFIAYSAYSLFLASGTKFVSTISVEMDREVPHWWLMPMVLPIGRILPISCLDHGKIMVRLFSPCNTVDVCISYGLIGSLVSLCNHGTRTLAF